MDGLESLVCPVTPLSPAGLLRMYTGPSLEAANPCKPWHDSLLRLLKMVKLVESFFSHSPLIDKGIVDLYPAREDAFRRTEED